MVLSSCLNGTAGSPLRFPFTAVLSALLGLGSPFFGSVAAKNENMSEIFVERVLEDVSHTLSGPQFAYHFCCVADVLPYESQNPHGGRKPKIYEILPVSRAVSDPGRLIAIGSWWGRVLSHGCVN